jgi:hypothetical protein
MAEEKIYLNISIWYLMTEELNACSNMEAKQRS